MLQPSITPQLAAVLEDCNDQLAVLGSIAPDNASLNAVDTVVGDEIAKAVADQRRLEAEYDKLLKQRETLLKEAGAQERLLDNEASTRRVCTELKDSTLELLRTLKSNPGASDNIIKLENERRFVQEVITELLDEVRTRGSFQTLAHSVQQEKTKKAKMTDIIVEEEEGRKHLKSLQQRLQEEKDSMQCEIVELDEKIAQLKDELQELKARSKLEARYIGKEAVVRVAMKKKRFAYEEKALSNEAKQIQEEIEEDKRIHGEIVAFLKSNHAQLTEKLDMWLTKYEEDTAAKQQELDTLKADRSRDLATLQELTEKYKEYEQVVKAERERKQKQQEAAELAVKQLSAAIRLQAWWRGMLVRHKLGPFKSKKAKSAKGKGKKKKKGKKK